MSTGAKLHLKLLGMDLGDGFDLTIQPDGTLKAMYPPEVEAKLDQAKAADCHLCTVMAVGIPAAVEMFRGVQHSERCLVPLVLACEAAARGEG